MRIGLSSCIMHKDPLRAIFKGKALLYAEESLCHWILAQGAFAFLVPTQAPRGTSIKGLVAEMDGIILQGGVDVSPESYGEVALRPEWGGDKVRDVYEIALIQAALELDRPIFGICRGMQLMNVALGGTLFQDIETQNPGARVHRDWDVYDRNFHEAAIVPGSRLSGLYPDISRATINSVHHQGVKDLGKDLVVEAYSVDDGIVEAVRLSGGNRGEAFLAGVQWHPEFQDPADTFLLAAEPLLQDFLDAVKTKARQRGA